MEESSVLVSIICPVYNAEKWLSRAIESALKQTYQNIELLLINDGSKDNSLKICQEYAEKDSRVRVFDQENAGVSSARNVGLKNMKGEWFLFLDSDDYLMEVAVEKLVDRQKETDADMIYGSVQRLEDGEFKPFYSSDNVVSDNPCEYLLNNRLKCCSVGYMLKASICRDFNVYQKEGVKNGEDLLFISTYSAFANQVVEVPDLVYTIFVNKKSVTFTINYEERINENIKVYNGLIEISRLRDKEEIRMIAENHFSDDFYDYFYTHFSLSTLKETYSLVKTKTELTTLKYIRIFVFMFKCVFVNKVKQKICKTIGY